MVAQVTTYRVIATQEERFWLLSVPELDVVTQARTLDRAEATVRDLIAVWLDVPADSFAVEVEPRLGDEWTKLLRETRDARTTADKASARASELLRTSVTTLHDAGLSAREVGSLMGISYQRVQQLLAEGIGQRSQSRDRR
jgi:DNA-directed RNA polymerase specialized sigma24 family protein